MNRRSEVFDLIINALKNNGAMFRGELVDVISLPRSTIYDNIDYLVQNGIVTKYEAKRAVGDKGRSKVLFHYVGGN